MKSGRTGSYRRAWLGNLLILGLSGLTAAAAQAQSDARIEERLFADWGAPTIEEFNLWLAAVEKRKLPAGEAAAGLESKVKDARQALEKGSGTAVRAKLARRYADLVSQLAEAQRAKELAAAAGKPTVDHTTSIATMQTAIEAYRALFEEFPKFRNRLELQLRLATLLARTGSPNALPAFQEVINAKKKGPHANRAMLGAAEVLIATGKIDEAQKQLDKLKDRNDKLAMAYASWRLAWVMAANKPAAMATAKPIGRLKKMYREPCDKAAKGSTKVVCDQVQRDLIVAFADAGRIKESRKFFGERDGEAWALTSERYGARQLAAGKAREAADVLAPVVAEMSTRDRAPQAHAVYARALAAAGDGPSACKALESMHGNYVSETGDWRKSHAEAAASAGELTAQTMRGLMDDAWSKGRSATANATTRATALASANCIAALYLKSFPDAPDVPKVRMNYAGSLADAGNILEAARQYYLAAGDKRTLDDDRTLAGQRMLVLARQALASVTRRGAATVGTLAKPVELDPTKKVWIDVVGRYGEVFPQDKLLPDLRFDAGLLLAEEGHDAPAIKALDQVTRDHAASDAAPRAVRLVVAMHRARKSWDTLITTAKEYIGRSDLGRHNLHADLRAAWRDGMWFKAEQFAVEKKPLEAARGWIAFQREFPTDRAADQALAKASGAYLGEGKGQAGIEACEMLISGYVASPLRNPCEWSSAQIREQMVQFEESARAYERFGSDYPKDPRAMEALRKAAALYKEGGNSDMAARIWLGLSKSANKAEAGEAWLRIGEIKEKGEEMTDAVSAFRQAATLLGPVRGDDALFAEAKAAALIAERIDENDGVQALARVTARLAATSGQGAMAARDVTAEAYLRLASRVVEEASGWSVSWVDAVAFNQTQQNLSRQLAGAVANFERVIAIGKTKYAGTANVLAGELYERAIAAYKAPPADTDMSPDERSKAVQTREAFLLNARTRMLAHWRTALKDTRPGPIGDRVREVALGKLARHEAGKDSETPEMILKPTFALFSLPKE